MSVRERDGVGPADRLPSLHRAAAHVAEAPPLDVLDHRVGLAGPLVDRGVEHLRHARVLELRLDPRFVEEASDEARILGVLAADDLHDHGALGAFEARRRGEQTSPIPPRAMRSEQDVAAQRARGTSSTPRTSSWFD